MYTYWLLSCDDCLVYVIMFGYISRHRFALFVAEDDFGCYRKDKVLQLAGFDSLGQVG